MHGLNEMRCDDDTGRRCDAIDDDFDSIDSRRTARGSTRSVPSATRGGGDARARERRCIVVVIIIIFIFIFFIIIGRRGETGGGAGDRGIQTPGRWDADECEGGTGDDVHRTFGDVPVVVFGGGAVDAGVRREGGGGGDGRAEVDFERDGVVGGERCGDSRDYANDVWGVF